MSIFETSVVRPWSEPGIAIGSLLVSFPSGFSEYPYGGKLIPLLEAFANSDPEHKAVGVVLGEVNERQYDMQNRLAQRPDLTEHLAALVSFGREFGGGPSHFTVDMCEYAKTDEAFVGGEILGGRKCDTIDLMGTLRNYALKQVSLEIVDNNCTLSAH